jgi:tripartite-type tricarboxylate transporter receptor subunit TctC
VPIAFGVLPPALGNIQAGKLNVIAVTSKKRFSLLPDVPTFDESGLPGFEAVLHYGLLAPAGTPKEIVDKLYASLAKVMANDEVKKKLLAVGIEPTISKSPADFAAFIKAQAATREKVIKAVGMKLD